MLGVLLLQFGRCCEIVSKSSCAILFSHRHRERVLTPPSLPTSRNTTLLVYPFTAYDLSVWL